MKIKAREIKPLDILIMRTFLHGETQMKVHFTAPSFRDSTKVNAYGFDGESVMFDADMTVEVIRGGVLDEAADDHQAAMDSLAEDMALEEIVAFERDNSAPIVRPTKPGQSVRSELDGTLGVTISRVGKSDYLTGNYIDVMFLGSVAPGPFDCYDLTVVDVEEVKP